MGRDVLMTRPVCWIASGAMASWTVPTTVMKTTAPVRVLGSYVSQHWLGWYSSEEVLSLGSDVSAYLNSAVTPPAGLYCIFQAELYQWLKAYSSFCQWTV